MLASDGANTSDRSRCLSRKCAARIGALGQRVSISSALDYRAKLEAGSEATSRRTSSLCRSGAVRVCPMNETMTANSINAAGFVRDDLPPGGLFTDQHWRVSPTPFPLGPELAKELETLGRVLLQFYRAVNLLYR